MKAGGGGGGGGVTGGQMLPPLFIRVTLIEHGLRPAFDIKSCTEGRAGHSTDQISTLVGVGGGGVWCGGRGQGVDLTGFSNRDNRSFLHCPRCYCGLALILQDFHQ